MKYLLLSMLCAVLGLSRAEDNALMARIPEMLQVLCPGSNVCRDNVTVNVSSEELNSGFDSCCTDCSCHTECFKTGNCCFQGQESDDITDTKQIKESCLSLSVSLIKDEVIPYMRYTMITAVEHSKSNGRKVLKETDCGDKKVAPWGSFYPVFSRIKNRLYKNIECANLDGIDDALYFELCLTCERFFPLMAEVHHVIEDVWNSNTNVDDCNLEFRYPGNIKALSRHVCDAINVCQATFTMPAEPLLNFSKEEIVEACKSGLWSPFQRALIYANVFCYICNGEVFSKDIACTIDELNQQVNSQKNIHGYAILVNTDFIFKLNKKDKRNIPAQRACLLDNSENCRPVHCPLGKAYDHLGRCDFPSRIWFNQIAHVTLNLKTAMPIDEADFDLIKDILKNKSTLKSPWPKQWQIMSIFSERLRDDLGHMNLLISIQNKIQQIHPKLLIQKIKRMVNRKWKLENTNKLFIFASNFSPYFLMPEYNEKDELFADRTEKTFYSRYLSHYENTYLHTINIQPITKLFLCDHVELKTDEFILSSNRNVLFNLITNNYLFRLEFLLSTSSRGKAAKVCIEDSGLMVVADPSNVSGSFHLNCASIKVALLMVIQTLFKT